MIIIFKITWPNFSQWDQRQKKGELPVTLAAVFAVSSTAFSAAFLAALLAALLAARFAAFSPAFLAACCAAFDPTSSATFYFKIINDKISHVICAEKDNYI